MKVIEISARRKELQYTQALYLLGKPNTAVEAIQTIEQICSYNHYDNTDDNNNGGRQDDVDDKNDDDDDDDDDDRL